MDYTEPRYQMNAARLLCAKTRYEYKDVWDERGYCKPWVMDLLKEFTQEAFSRGVQETAEWLNGAIYSHDVDKEHITISSKELEQLSKGIIPKEREHIAFGGKN